MKVLTPLVDLGLRSPKDDLEYAKKNGLQFESEKQTVYNVEQNLWGNNIQLRGLKDTWEEPPKDTYILTSPPEDSPAMKIILANPRGFCAGVNMAIDCVNQVLELKGPPIYVFHEIVHNKHVVESLKAKGAVFVEEVSEVPPNAVTILRATARPSPTPRWSRREASGAR